MENTLVCNPAKIVMEQAMAMLQTRSKPEEVSPQEQDRRGYLRQLIELAADSFRSEGTFKTELTPDCLYLRLGDDIVARLTVSRRTDTYCVPYYSIRWIVAPRRNNPKDITQSGWAETPGELESSLAYALAPYVVDLLEDK